MPTDFGPLKRVLLCRARDAFGSEARIESQWKRLGYLGPPDFEAAVRECDAFVDLLAGFGIEPLFLPAALADTLDSIYPRDAAMTTDSGMIVGSMGKPARRDEPAAHRRFYESEGIPVLGEVAGDGTLEGGDVTWLAPDLAAVGHGYRTNGEGIRQVAALLEGRVEEVFEVPLPHYRGPDDVFHLMSIISPVAPDLAVVYSPLLPVVFRNRLLDEGFRLVEVPDVEFETLGCNVLAVAPGVCVMVEGNPVTRRRLLDAGAEVHTFAADEICRKGCGGPTCLTRPLPEPVD